MKNMKIATKLTVSFLIVSILAVVISAVGIVNLSRTSAETINNQQYITLPIEYMAKFAIPYGQVRSSMRDMGRSTTQEENEKHKAALENNLALCQENIGAYYALIQANPNADPDELKAVKTLNDTLGVYSGIILNQLVPAGMSNDNEQVLAYIFGDLTPPGAVMRENIDLLSTTLSENGAQSAVIARDTFRASVIFNLVLLVAALIIVVILVRHLSGLIVRPLLLMVNFMRRVGTTGDITLGEAEINGIEALSHVRDEIGELSNSLAALIGHITKISGVLEKIAEGDLTGKLDVMSEKDVMGISLTKMQDNLNEMFSEIRIATEQVSDESHQIADGAQMLAQGTTEQAATIEELSASISEIAQKTQDNAGMAKKAAGLTGVITQNAAKGSEQMDEMMAAVNAINESSQSIGKVIKVIDDIAFQTNILALNAAVEAARAGQHGKGFAVVADEVRNLAAKSAAAAKDTNQLIADSTEKAKSGSKIAEETARSLAEIVSGISESDQLIGEITKSSLAQNAGIEEINTGINQVTNVIQQSSATAEESAAAAEELSGQSALLRQLLSRFRVKD